jgi:type II secretory pathway pseudopilin PulG
MKKLLALACISLVVPLAGAQETNQVEQLKQQLQQLQMNLETMRKEQQAQIDELTRKLEALTGKQNAPATRPPAASVPTNPPAGALSAPSPAAAWSPAQPITLTRAGSAYLNISFDVLTDVGGSTEADPSKQLELGDHDPGNNGFSLPNAEIALDGAVDPYFKGFGNIAFKLDHNDETSVELEEAYALTTDLPADLQAKAGQFYAAFGRQNPQHPHQWAFVDEPLILNRTLGPDGLRNIGAQLSWLAPTPFYTEASVAVYNGQGETAFSFRNPGEDVDGVLRFHGRETIDRTLRGPGDLLYVPHLTTSFDLTDQQTLVAGVSAAFGPNDTGSRERTQIYGADLYWKWKPANAHAGFPFVSWQTEAAYQIFDAAANLTNPPPQLTSLPAETLRDWGFYSQVLWGFKERWVAGLRGEYVDGNPGAYDPWDVYRNQRTRVSPALTYYPSEFSKLRLQFNYDHGRLFGDQYSVWLQFEFLLGAHGAHKF